MTSSSTLFHISIALTIIFVLSPIIASTTSEEPNNAFTFPIKKDDATLQYTIDKVQIGLGSTPIKLSIDIGGWVLWFNNDAGYNASAYQSLSCNDDECGPDPTNVMLFCGTCLSRSKTLPPCNQSSACSLNDINPFIMKLGSYAYPGAGLSANIARDGLLINSTRGKKTEAPVPIHVPDFRFSYVNSTFVTKLASGSRGVAGLGNSPMSLPNQIISTYNVTKQFSICLSPYSTSTGSLSIGASNKTASHRDLLTTTPLLEKYVGDNSWPANIPSTEYFIGVTSINVDGETVPFDTSLLSFDNEDTIGGTRLSTGVPYTAFHSDIYDSLVKVYKEKAADMKMEEAAAAVAPFEVCYVAKTVNKTVSGDFCVPGINLVLQNSSVYWRMEGHNVMKKVNRDVMCLAIVDGGVFFPYMVQYGESLVTAITIGGHQLESKFLEFDLGSSVLRFSSSSLVAQGSSCSHLKGKYL